MKCVSAGRTPSVLAALFVSLALLGAQGVTASVPIDASALPEPPRTYLDTTYALPTGGTVYNVSSAALLQTVLDAAHPGDVIVLSAGVTFTGHFTLRNQSGSGWIYVISSALNSLPPAGTRVTPASAGSMPKIVTPDFGPAITTDPGAHHYRFVGIEFVSSMESPTLTNVGLINLGSSITPTVDDLPHHITFDRCYVHGTLTGNHRRGITMNSASTAIVDSYFEEFHERFADSQAVVSWNGPGPFKLVNNFFSAAGENVMFGGSDPSIPDLVPSDIEIRSNYFYKPLKWKEDDPSYAGIRWIVKNLLEFKNAQRALVQGNVLENNWQHSQNGLAVLVTPRNQNGFAPWSVVQDVAFQQNIIRRTGGGFGLLGTDNEQLSQRAARVLIRDNLLTDIFQDEWGTGWAFGVFQTAHTGPLVGVDHLTIDHNTVLPTSAIVVADAGGDLVAQDHFVFTNNIAEKQFFGTGIGTFVGVLNVYFDAPLFTANALIGTAPNALPGYPGNFYPSNLASVGFVDPDAGNFELSPTSPFKNAGLDGRDLGADIASLNAAVACAVTGSCTVTVPLIGGTVQVSNITDTSATITWTTNQVADSQIEYGLTTDYGSTTTIDASLVLTHVQTLTGLAAATTYHFRVMSRNTAGLAVSGDFTFTTAPPPPVASALNVTAITASSAIVGWTTDQLSDSQVEYGPTTAYGNLTFVNPLLVTTHAESLSGLTPGTTYHYRVKSRNSEGVTGTSADATFTTLPAPIVTNLTISNIQGSTAAVTWLTDQAADTQIEYGLTTAYGSFTTLNPTLSTGHGQALSGLATGTLYHLRVRSRNAAGDLGTSPDTTFTTAPAPLITAVGTSSMTGTSVVVSWTTDLPSNTRIEYGLTPSLGSQTPLDPAMVTSHSQTISGLTPGATYFFLVRSTTAQNALSKVGGFTFTTLLPPVIGGVGVSGITATGATINWSTNQSADSQIEYGPTTAYGSSTTLDPALVTTHVQILSGLTSQTTYHYRVKSQNGGGLSTSGDFTFTTPEPLPVISNVTASAVTSSTALITWTTDLPSDSVVVYGPTTVYGSLTIGCCGPASTAHSVALTTDLLPATTYHYRVRSSNSGGSAFSADGTFTTLAPAPLISSVAASGVTTTSATIGWLTDYTSNSQVEYGLTTAYGGTTTLDPTLTTVHSQGLTGLAPGTTYHYRVRSASTGGVGTSGDFTFTTVVPAPVIGGVLVPAITTTSATIGWTTDWPADGQVEYGPTTAYGSVTVINPVLLTSHSQTLVGLSTGTTYHFRLKSRTNGGLTTSEDFTFATLVPAPVLSNITASGIAASSALIEWTTNSASSSQVEYGLTTAYGNTTALDTNAVSMHSQPLTGLSSGTLYHYRVISTTNGGTTTSGDFTFLTLNAAPVISSVVASSLTTTSATVGWTTDLASTSQVEYGLTIAYGNITPLGITPVTAHSQLLTGLTGGTTYHVRVRSSTNGGTTTSGDFTFTTVDPAPVLSDIASSAITANSATITWTTDRAADSQVEYGTTTAYGSTTTLEPALVTAHSQSLTGLTPGTIYHYRVKSRTAGGLTVSGDGVFTTTPLPPAISNVAASAVTNTAALIGWTTDQLTDSQVEYGLTTAYGSTTAIDPALITTHSQALSGLAAGTTYHYRVKSRNAAGMLSESSDFAFTTTTAPTVTNVTVSNVQGQSAAITWMTNQAADTQIEYGLTTSYGSMTTLNATLSTGHGQAVNSGLNPGTTYHFRVRSRNAAGLLGTSADLTFTTAPAPVITNVSTTDVTGTSVVVTWTTDLPSNSKIEYGTTPSLGSQTTLDPALVTSHSHVISGLTPGTTYFFLIRSTTAQNALTKLGGFTFTTLAAPVISGVNASAVTGATATISWTTNVPADSRVEYGPTTAYGSTTALDPALVTGHSQGLAGLLPLTTYHYRVRSQNSVGVTTSGDFTFTTTDPLPIISDITTSGITSSSAFVNWTTDRLADSQIEYGLTTAYGTLTALDPALVLSHGQPLSGLAGGTTYHYRVRSANSNGLTVSTDQIFRTLFPPPVFFNVTASQITATSATISWTTDQVSDSTVEYGLTSAYGSSVGPAGNPTTSHSMSLVNLVGGTTYHYRVLSRNGDGQLGMSADGVFTTRPVPIISNVTISNITGNTAAITWMTDVPADTQIDYGLTTNYGGLSPLNATLSTGHGQAISGLTIGTTYHIRVRSRNALGDLGVSADFTFTTASAPVISNVAITQLTPTSVVVTWTTDLASNSKIEYGLTTSYGLQTTLDPALVTSHSHTISGLTPGTTYFFLVRSITAQNALSKLGGFSFTTPPQ
jgi:phosphodiesterase/alkaline phosphatase D-like protein